MVKGGVLSDGVWNGGDVNAPPQAAETYGGVSKALPRQAAKDVQACCGNLGTGLRTCRDQLAGIAVASVNIWRGGRPPSRSAVAQNRRDITSAQPAVSELQLVNQRGGLEGRM